jgi:hypothetical protein
MAFTFLSQLSTQSLTAVPGQDVTFTVQSSSNDVSALSAAYTYLWYTSASTGTVTPRVTSASYTFDPLIGDNGLAFFATSNFLSGSPATTFVSQITSSRAILTVQEDVPPFDVYDVGSETGRQRHRRLRLLGYV